MLATDITIHTFTGSGMKPYLSSIARLSVEVFREYPFLCDTHLEIELEFLEKYAECEESIVVIVFDGSTIVGASTGIPLEKESEPFIKPFRQAGWDVSKLFHFGESLLLKPYRGRGIGHHFFDLREKHVKDLHRFSHVCFCCVDREEEDPLKPENYRSLDDFWRRRGFVHHREIKAYITWKDLAESHPSLKENSFWIKELA